MCTVILFFPRRLHGKTLVICCEGNAGFYEIGVMGTPLEAGYSVLGWNHPGFYGSTGVPLPSQASTAYPVRGAFSLDYARGRLQRTSQG